MMRPARCRVTPGRPHNYDIHLSTVLAGRPRLPGGKSIGRVAVENFTPLSAVIGGGLIGIAVALLFVLNGRLAGVSGIVAALLPPAKGETSWRILFLAGLVIGTVMYIAVAGDTYEVTFSLSWPFIVIGGLLTGLGTRIGGGCTSGHGVCGIGRLSQRSIVATMTFMVFGGLTVFAVRHLMGV